MGPWLDEMSQSGLSMAKDGLVGPMCTEVGQGGTPNAKVGSVTQYSVISLGVGEETTLTIVLGSR